MRFAAIADVHGNCAALEAVLADIAGAGLTEIVNLGDHLSGPLEPRRTADLLMGRGFPSIRCTDTSGRPVSCETYATRRPFGEKRASRSGYGWASSGRAASVPSAGSIQTS